MSRVALVFGDQLSLDLTSLAALDRDLDRVLMMEVSDESEVVPHHPKKLVFQLSAMRHFAETLRAEGFNVDYIDLAHDGSLPSFSETLTRYSTQASISELIIARPSEYRVQKMVDGWGDAFDFPVTQLADTRFVCSPEAFSAWAEGRKQLTMEYFYREMRRTTGYLMDGDNPIGGKWNYDKENRRPLAAGVVASQPPQFAPDAITEEVIAEVKRRYGTRFGDILPFTYAVTRADALVALGHFVEFRLPQFGDFQDAMQAEQAFVFHSVLSHYLNVGLLLATEVCDAAVAAYERGHAPINAVEGLVRQLIGWREFVRGVYLMQMPHYATNNFLQASEPLPASFWGAPTKMRCVASVVRHTREHAYSHHIQRLMVTGNFALLLGVDPTAVHEWYLAVYADAYEWVEMPNTLGMALYADGGTVGTKPYAASGSYINKMSNFCEGCTYKVKAKQGDAACPFNYLYWDFMDRHRERLAENQRLRFPLNQLGRFDEARLTQIRADADAFRARLAAGEA